MNLRIIFRKKFIIYIYVDAFAVLENKCLFPIPSDTFINILPEVNISDSSVTEYSLQGGGMNGTDKIRTQNLPLIEIKSFNRVRYVQSRLPGPNDFLITWNICLPTEGNYLYSYSPGAYYSSAGPDGVKPHTVGYDICPSLNINLLNPQPSSANTLIEEIPIVAEDLGEWVNYDYRAGNIFYCVNVTYYRVS